MRFSLSTWLFTTGLLTIALGFLLFKVILINSSIMEFIINKFRVKSGLAKLTKSAVYLRTVELIILVVFVIIVTLRGIALCFTDLDYLNSLFRHGHSQTVNMFDMKAQGLNELSDIDNILNSHFDVDTKLSWFDTVDVSTDYKPLSFMQFARLGLDSKLNDFVFATVSLNRKTEVLHLSGVLSSAVVDGHLCYYLDGYTLIPTTPKSNSISLDVLVPSETPSTDSLTSFVNSKSVSVELSFDTTQYNADKVLHVYKVFNVATNK